METFLLVILLQTAPGVISPVVAPFETRADCEMASVIVAVLPTIIATECHTLKVGKTVEETPVSERGA